MKKNVAGQVVGAQLVSATDGSAVTSGVTDVFITGDGGTQGQGNSPGAATHKGRGWWEYYPSAGETNYDHVAFTFVNSSAVGVTKEIFTTFPQTGDFYGYAMDPVGACPALGILDAGTAQGATASTLQRRSAADFGTSDAIAGAFDYIFSGTGLGQTRGILTSVNSTDTDTLDSNWTVTPSGTIKYVTFSGATAPTTAPAVNVTLWKGATAPAMTGDAFARLGAPAGASVSADVAAAKVDTAAIKTKTDSLTFTVSGMVDSNVIDWKGATAPAMTGDAFARLGAPAGASVSADIAAAKVDTAAIKVVTDKFVFTSTNYPRVDLRYIVGTAVGGDGTGTPWHG